MIRNNIDKTLYDWKPVNKVNGMPWPRLPDSFDEEVKVPLKEEYLFRSMDYLDTEEALPIFEIQADIIIDNGYKGIVDIGCRHGPVNDILYDRGYYDYNYMGFDTSPQPIDYANAVWSNSPNIEYRCASWNDIEKIDVDFKVDCLIWSGVLLYEPETHMELFERLHKFYNAPHAIIQEPCSEQPKNKWLENLTLNTIEDQLYLYKEKYSKYQDVIVNRNIFSGRRKIVSITL